MSVDSEVHDAIQWFGRKVPTQDGIAQSHYAKAVLDRYHGWQRLEAEIALMKRGYDPNRVPFDEYDLALPIRPGTGYEILQRAETLVEQVLGPGHS